MVYGSAPDPDQPVTLVTVLPGRSLTIDELHPADAELLRAALDAEYLGEKRAMAWALRVFVRDRGAWFKNENGRFYCVAYSDLKEDRAAGYDMGKRLKFCPWMDHPAYLKADMSDNYTYPGYELLDKDHPDYWAEM